MPLIAILDDEKALREIITDELMNEGYEVVAHEDKDAFLDLLPVLQPDLIISDINSPRMSGLEFLHAIKSDERYKHIPVIIVSGALDLQTALHVAKLGASDCLSKPFDAGELLEVIQRALMRV